MSEDTTALIDLSRVPTRVSIHCNGCGTLSRIYRTEPTVQIGAFKYCPLCGSHIMPRLSGEDSGWEALAVAYNMSVPAIRAVYNTWNPNDYYKFSDFIAALREEARTGQPQPTKPYIHHRTIPMRPTTFTTTQLTDLPSPPLPRMRVPT